jgi:AraC-like DNA-binding protein
MTSTNLPPPNDPWGEALHHLRISGTFYCRSECSDPWAMDLPPMDGCLMFHIVTAGACWLEVDGEAPHRLQVGGFALVPHGLGHRLTSAPGVPAVGLFDAPTEHVSERYDVVRLGGGGPATTLVCGAVTFDHPAAADLIARLPRVIVIDTWQAPEHDWMQSTLRFIASEVRMVRPGTDMLVTRLSDILVMQSIRAWLASEPPLPPGWLAAVRDPQIGRALRSVHREPGEPWTIASLARVAGMSRSAFAARFAVLAGEPVMRYVTRWRMNLAAAALHDGGETTAALAERLGYESEAAFSRAFKRVMGSWPGAVRRQASHRPSAGNRRAPAGQHGADPRRAPRAPAAALDQIDQ